MADQARLELIATTAAEVRRLQCRYFATRDRDVLRAAQEAERRLDALLAAHESRQGRLL